MTRQFRHDWQPITYAVTSAATQAAGHAVTDPDPAEAVKVAERILAKCKVDDHRIRISRPTDIGGIIRVTVSATRRGISDAFTCDWQKVKR